MLQVFFSKRCPLIQGDLPLLQKILYTNGGFRQECGTEQCSSNQPCVRILLEPWHTQ
jgi:hypothetical protein